MTPPVASASPSPRRAGETYSDDGNNAERTGSQVQTADEAADEITKLQREIDMLENQKQAIDDLGKPGAAPIEQEPEKDDIEVGQVGATPSQLKPFAPQRVGPDGVIKNDEVQVEIE